MKAMSNAMLEYLASDSAQLCSCWRLQLRDGTNMGFTDSDNDQSYLGLKYAAATGFTRSAIETPVDLSPPNLELTGLISSDGILDSDIRAGRYDFAQIWVFAMVPGDVNGDKYGIIKIRRGWLGQIVLHDGQHVTELRGLSEILAQNFVELYTLECQADFGDAKCKFDLATVTDTGTVMNGPGIGGYRSFIATMSTPRADDFYSFGTVEWTSGKNIGLTCEVKNWTAGVFNLFLPLGYPIGLGDTFTAVAGCDKSFNTCLTRFLNTINFRGFPYIPGLDTTIYPNAAQAVPVSI
jgi:uncharacterized phage protein (TIGR02218 family)